MWCAADNYKYMCHICAKGFLDSNLNQAVIDKISNFQEIAPNFTYSQNLNFSNCFFAINFMAGHERNVLFHFCQLWANNKKISVS